jgi:hypothetical protein
MLRAATSDTELLTLEHAGFGVSHDSLGAALCDSWGLGSAALVSVRHHVLAQATGQLPSHVSQRSVCALSVLAHAMMTAPDTLDEVALAVAPQADLDSILVQRAAKSTLDELSRARAVGRR